jgi:hypothetical protein
MDSNSTEVTISSSSSLRPPAALLTLASILLSSAAVAGTATTTVGGQAAVTAPPGAQLVLDHLITFGPTTVGGGSPIPGDHNIDVWLDTEFGRPISGPSTVPSGWIDATPGFFFCSGSSCTPLVSAIYSLGGQVFNPGDTFAPPSVTLDTTCMRSN